MCVCERACNLREGWYWHAKPIYEGASKDRDQHYMYIV